MEPLTDIIVLSSRMETTIGVMKLNLRALLLLLIGVLCFTNCERPKEEIKREILWTAAWSPDGNLIAVGGRNADLMLFDGKTFELVKIIPVPDVILSRLKWHPDSKLLAVVTQSDKLVARILNVETDTWIPLEGLMGSSRGVGWNHTGALLAVSEFEGEVSVFTPEGKRVSRFMADPMSVTDLDWHPTKDIMVTVGSRAGIYSAQGDSITTFKVRDNKVLLLCTKWHPSGEFFAIGDYGETDAVGVENVKLQFWNADGEKIHEITSGQNEYRNIRWSPDTAHLASASEALRIWSKDGNLLFESSASDDLLWGVDWSPDGKQIITSSIQGNIILWDNKANKIRELEY